MAGKWLAEFSDVCCLAENRGSNINSKLGASFGPPCAIVSVYIWTANRNRRLFFGLYSRDFARPRNSEAVSLHLASSSSVRGFLSLLFPSSFENSFWAEAAHSSRSCISLFKPLSLSLLYFSSPAAFRNATFLLVV